MRSVKMLAPALALLAACAGPTGEGRPHGVRLLYTSVMAAVPEEQHASAELIPGEVTRHQRESECRLAAEQVWRALGPVDAVGAEVEHRYWTNHGALTLVSLRLLAQGGARGAEADSARFVRTLWPVLCEYVPSGAGYLRLVHRRTPSGWVLTSAQGESSEAMAPPPEAKTLPVAMPEIAAEPFAALEREAQRWRPLLRAPRAGTASVELELDFYDERLVVSSVLRRDSAGSGAWVEAPPAFETRLAGVLVPFTQGLWRRAVRVRLEAVRTPGEDEPEWQVMLAETIRPKGGRVPPRIRPSRPRARCECHR